jgi:tripartite-type tricarboxylate transporter receptor subunit TctC
MKFPRRQFLHLVAGTAAASSIIPSVVWALEYPTKLVRLIAPFAPGGVVDIFARLIGQWLSERLGKPVIVENRPGAGSNIGTEAVVRAVPDGYTLLQIGSQNTWNTTLYENLTFNFIRDIVPVAGIVKGFGVLVVNPSFPVNSVQELIAYAKANPGKVTMSSAGIGSSNHLYGELFKSMAGVDMLHVPYRGGAPALTDLIAGQVQLTFEPISTAIPHINAGRLRALAVTSLERSELLPGLPTVGEFVPGYEATVWQGIGVPRNTPVEIIDMLNKEINAGLDDHKIKVRIAELGYAPLKLSPNALAKLIADDTEKWGKVIKSAGIRAE